MGHFDIVLPTVWTFVVFVLFVRREIEREEEKKKKKRKGRDKILSFFLSEHVLCSL